MKICMFTNTYLPHVGGVARSVHTCAEGLRERGHQVLIFAPSFAEDEKLAENPHEVVRLPALQNFNGSDFSVHISLPGEIPEELEAFEPDIIHSHHPFLLGDLAVRCGHHYNRPVVFTHHTLYENYTHYVPFDSAAMQRFAIDLATRYANMCSRVIAPSESIARLITERGVEIPHSIVPTGVDTEHFAAGDGIGFRKRFSIPESAKVIGHLGRLAPEKNLPYLTEVGLQLCREYPDLLYLVAGNGPEKENIQQAFSSAGLDKQIILTGEVTGNDVRDCYAAMDLFLFASKSETQGIVLVEAMATGQPVVALDASGAREVVRDGKNGYLLNEQSETDAFAAKVRSLLESPEKLNSFSQEAQSTAQEFSIPSCIEKLEDVYQRTITEYVKNQDMSFDSWDALLDSIRVEWDLISSKLGAAFDAVSETVKEEISL